MNQYILTRSKAYFVVSFVNDKFFSLRMYDKEESAVTYQTAVTDLGGKAFILPNNKEIFKQYTDTFDWDIDTMIMAECYRLVQQHNNNILRDFL